MKPSEVDAGRQPLETDGELIDAAETDELRRCARTEETHARLDVLLTKLFPEDIPSRSRAQKLLDAGAVAVDGRQLKAGAAVKAGSVVEVLLPEAEVLDVEPENIPLDIVYEDSDLIVVNKPRGMVVHPAVGNYSGTLVNALLYHCSDLSEIGGVVRPGIVHRIDKDTTGLLAVAKNDRTHLSLSEQLKARTMHRIYLAVAEGIVKPETGVINAPIDRSPKDRKQMAVVPGGREAVTHYRVLRTDSASGTSLLRLSLDTGRTHQIRVHLKYIGHPVTGDPVYGLRKRRGMTGQALHAGILMLTHPATGEALRFTCPPPEDFEKLLTATNLKQGEELFWL